MFITLLDTFHSETFWNVVPSIKIILVNQTPSLLHRPHLLQCWQLYGYLLTSSADHECL